MPVPPGTDVEAATGVLRDRMEALLRSAQQAYEHSPADESDRWWLPARLGGTAPTPEQAAALDEAERRDRVRRYAAQAKAARARAAGRTGKQ